MNENGKEIIDFIWNPQKLDRVKVHFAYKIL